MAGRQGKLFAAVLVALVALPSPARAVTEFPLPDPPGQPGFNSQPAGIAVGSDGALWFTEENAHKIGRITTGGTITEFQVPTVPSAPSEITAGPDGALWFTEIGANPPKIGRVTTAGVFTEYDLPAGTGPDGITAGPDGALWYTASGTNKIGRIPTSGPPIQEFDLPPEGFLPGDITPGPDGRLWFTEPAPADKIGAITTAGFPKLYDLPPGTDPSSIAASAGAMWFTEHGLDQIGRISVLGIPINHFGPTGDKPSGVAFGSDGALWFTEEGSDRIGRMTTSGSISSFAIPTPGSEPGTIVAGPDGAMWFTERVGDKIGRIEVGGTLPQTHFSPSPVTSTPPKSQSKKKCRVPAVRGLSVRKARKKLRRAGCRYRVRGKGKVISTKPRAGSRTAARVEVKAKRKRRAR
jgi:streptogramin lyase